MGSDERVEQLGRGPLQLSVPHAPANASTDASTDASRSGSSDAVFGAASDDQIVGALESLRVLINQATALQMRLLAEVARREDVRCEDGTVEQHRRALGHVSIDAASLVCDALGVSEAASGARVETAARVMAHLPTVLAALEAGEIDGWRAQVIATELSDADPQVCRSVDARLAPHLSSRQLRHGGQVCPELPGPLRRRVRALRVACDGVGEAGRAEQARQRRGLQRWAGEPGLDTWLWRLPQQQSESLWSGVDARARELRAAGAAHTLEQARGDALEELLAGQVTANVSVVITVPCVVPAEGVVQQGGASGVTEVGNGPAVDAAVPGSARGGEGVAGLDGSAMDVAVPGYGPGGAGVAGLDGSAVDAAVPGYGQDRERVLFAGGDADVKAVLVCTQAVLEGLPADRHIVVRTGRAEPVVVRAGWLRDQLSAGVPVRLVRVDAQTGALCDPQSVSIDAHGADFHGAQAGYRPGARLRAAVQGRDGRFRFPGCSVAVRFTDLDHVRPWPLGPTAFGNLVSLCRRHHRVKQLPRWSLVLLLGGLAVWTDPAGRRRVSAPVDYRGSLG